MPGPVARATAHRVRGAGESHVGRLADGSLHRGDLRLGGQHHDQPEPAEPRRAQPRARAAVSNAASVVLPWVIAYRPSSTWTKTLITQLRRISQSRLKPALAPRLVVLISSPVPTIDAARISPGPTCRTRRTACEAAP